MTSWRVADLLERGSINVRNAANFEQLTAALDRLGIAFTVKRGRGGWEIEVPACRCPHCGARGRFDSFSRELFTPTGFGSAVEVHSCQPRI